MVEMRYDVQTSAVLSIDELAVKMYTVTPKPYDCILL